MDNAAKVCALCGCDCTSRPRVKDAKGRYYCRECYDKAQAKTRPAAHASSPPRAEQPAHDAADALQNLLHAERTVSSAKSDDLCPSCGATIAGGVICMACGYDVRTGKRLAMQVKAAPAIGAESGSPGKLAAVTGLLGSSTPLILGIVGGLIGAVIWAAVAYGLDREIGYVAILVGVLAGLGMAAGGASGPRAGVIAALIAVAAICAGKVGAMYYVVGSLTQKVAAKTLTQDRYDEYKQDAAAFAQLKDKSDYPQFMVRHGFTEAAQPQAVTADEISSFEAETVPSLRKFHAEQPTLDQWKTQFVRSFRSNIPFSVMLKESLGVLDILFFILAIGAAYRIPAGSGVP